jgi:hypothetical protein
MANLEYVIRPYQTPDVYGRIVIPSSSTRADRATLTWGATTSGTVPTATPKKTNDMTYQFDCCNEGLTEQSRLTNRIRITGNDPDNWVDVERPYQLKLKKQTQQDCDSSAQISYVTQGINAVLNDFTDAFDEVASHFGTQSDCRTQWNLSQ